MSYLFVPVGNKRKLPLSCTLKSYFVCLLEWFRQSARGTIHNTLCRWTRAAPHISTASVWTKKYFGKWLSCAPSSRLTVHAGELVICSGASRLKPRAALASNPSKLSSYKLYHCTTGRRIRIAMKQSGWVRVSTFKPKALQGRRLPKALADIVFQANENNSNEKNSKGNKCGNFLLIGTIDRSYMFWMGSTYWGCSVAACCHIYKSCDHCM